MKIQENIKILRLKKDKKDNLYKRENFKPEIKPMIETLQNELCKNCKTSGFPIVKGHEGAPLPHLTIFFKPPSHQN